ncbi:unnamed protein product [Thlaspi arvense]|uniref:Uncharacterized protein n=1 Tax=Thlaspi arvense TaxID=13288 RepID=A0AAU9S4N7_THLAR|nr:unnamed protein product [Thlaspi arvense]
MLVSMSSELMKQYDHLRHASEIYTHLEELYKTRDKHEKFAASRELFRAQMTKAMFVHEHGTKMIRLNQKLEKS